MTVALARSALRQLDELSWHYAQIQRPEAVRNLRRAVAAAIDRIAANPDAGLAAPRPYPEIAQARPGYRWIFSGRYWFAYRLGPPAIIVAVFYEEADILRRLDEGRD